MPYLGTPYRLIYEAKSLRSGLNDVKAFIVKPDSTVAGIFAMAEVPLVTFQGVYVYDLMTSNNDPEGEWLGIFLSPSEGVKYTFRISLQKNPATALQSLIANFLANGLVEELQGYFTQTPEWEAKIDLSSSLIGYVEADELTSQSEEISDTVGAFEGTVEMQGGLNSEL